MSVIFVANFFESTTRKRVNLLLLWVFSFVLCSAVAIIWATIMYKWQKTFGYTITFKKQLTLPLINQWAYALLAPFIYLAGRRYPITRQTLRSRLPAYLIGGVVFSMLHVLIRILVYPVRDPRTGVMWGLFEPAGLGLSAFRSVFINNVVDDVVSFYVPVLVIAHAVVYHVTSTANSIRASELEKQLAQSQLHALTKELQPHFLFNTMNSISALMHTDVAAADSMMARLSELLRMTLENNGADENTVAEELQLLDAYLSIEQIRLRDRLSTELKIDPETLDALIPHLLLQPLAENAIRHGISKKPAGGTIRVSLARSNSKLRLVLSDNGPGFAAKPGESEPGLGLTITRERLQALYGTKHFFSIRSTAGGGVEVTIEVPFHTRIETTKAMEQSR